jgi:hypothetical protein
MKKITVVLCFLTLLFAACDYPSDIPETYTPAGSGTENGYGKIEIVFEEAALSTAARTALPSIAFDKYVYTFTKSDETTGTVKTPGSDGFFVLEVGNYTAEVQAYLGNGEPYTLAASGVSAPFSVGPGSNDPVRVLLSGISIGTSGEFSYTITWPVGAAAEITLQRWPELTDVALNPGNAPQGNGKTQTLQLEAGSYLLTVLVSKNDLYAGISEAVHINPPLSTVFSKSFVNGDLIAGIPPASNNYTVSGTGSFIYNGTERTVTIERAENASPGAITVFYNGTETPPVNAGYYAVTINVEAARGWTMAEGLPVGDIYITKLTPTVNVWPTAAAITYGAALSSSALSGGAGQPAGTFAWTYGGTIPDVTNNGYSVTFTPNDANYAALTKITAITVNKAAGAAVNAPTGTSAVTGNSITINAVTAPGSGQTVEYATNTTDSVPETGWQDSTTLSGLNPGTVYHIFARSKENANYQAGAASVGFPVTTLYMVTFSTWRDEIQMQPPAPQTFTLGTSITLPGGTSTINYVYDSWNTNFYGTGTSYPVNSSFTPEGNITLYAAWSSRVTFNSNGGTGTVPPSQQAILGSSIILPSGDGLSRTGYNFGGWSTVGSSSDAYAAGASYTPEKNVTLYAQWLAVVTFDINGGTGTTPAPRMVPANMYIVLSSSGFSKTGFILDGWNTLADGTGTTYYSFRPSGHITLYANWVVPRIVTYDNNGGTGTIPPQQVVPGNSVIIPDGNWLSKSDRVFGGWYTLDYFGQKIIYDAGSSYTPEENITLYANWLNSAASPYPLPTGWHNGSLTSSDSALWYSFNVTQGTTYYIWWNEGPSSSPNGDGTKTLNISVDARYATGQTIFNTAEQAWASPRTITAIYNGTVLLRVYPASGNISQTGTFAIAYTTINTRP